MPPSQQLTHVTTGLVTALDLSAVTDGTELNGLQGWTVYESGGTGNDFLEVRGGEIRQKATATTLMALWGTAAVGLPGQCVTADLYSPGWNGNPIPGLVCNGLLDHSQDIRTFLYNDYLNYARAGTADYGAGFPITDGHTTGNPFTNNTYYTGRFGVVQEPGSAHPREAAAFNGAVVIADNTASTGLNTGTAAYPGVIVWGVSGCRFRNLYVTRDYRIRVQGLTGTQGFKVFNSAGSALKTSSAQTSNAAYVSVVELTWPISGYVQVYNDAGTAGGSFSDPVGPGRYPESGNAALYGGDVFELPSIPTFVVQINWDDTDAWPDFWTIPDTKDVSTRVNEIHITRRIANPELTEDTAEIVLEDPDGDYVPAKVDSTVYPNVRLGRKLRIAWDYQGTVYPLFYGEIAEYAPAFRRPKRYTTIRAESPLRRLQNAVLTAAPLIGSATVLVDSSGTAGAIPTILDTIDGGSAVPLLNRALGPDSTQVQDVFTETWDNPMALLRELALLSQGYYYIAPQYRTLSGSPDWQFVWAAGATKVGTAQADFSWTSEEGDLDDLEIRYSGDVI